MSAFLRWQRATKTITRQDYALLTRRSNVRAIRGISWIAIIGENSTVAPFSRLFSFRSRERFSFDRGLAARIAFNPPFRGNFLRHFLTTAFHRLLHCVPAIIFQRFLRALLFCSSWSAAFRDERNAARCNCYTLFRNIWMTFTGCRSVE